MAISKEWEETSLFAFTVFMKTVTNAEFSAAHLFDFKATPSFQSKDKSWPIRNVSLMACEAVTGWSKKSDKLEPVFPVPPATYQFEMVSKRHCAPWLGPQKEQLPQLHRPSGGK